MTLIETDWNPVEVEALELDVEELSNSDVKNYEDIYQIDNLEEY